MQEEVTVRTNSESLLINLKSDSQFFGEDQKLANHFLIHISSLVYVCAWMRVCVCVCVCVCVSVEVLRGGGLDRAEAPPRFMLSLPIFFFKKIGLAPNDHLIACNLIVLCVI